MNKKDIDFGNENEALEYLESLNIYEIIDIMRDWLDNSATLSECIEFTELIQKIAEYHENNK